MIKATPKCMHSPVFWITGMIFFLSSLLGQVPAEAVLTPQSASGAVEVWLTGEADWKPLAVGIKFQAGDQIRTGADGMVELWFEDGSMLRLAAESHLMIEELDVSVAEKSRVARFKMVSGQVDAKVTKLAFTQSICLVQTETALVDIKYAELRIAIPKATNQTDVTVFQGLAEISQTGAGAVNVSGLFADAEGIAAALEGTGAKLILDLQKIVQKIKVESNLPLPLLNVMPGGNNTLKVENHHDIPLAIRYAENVAVLGASNVATFGFPAASQLTMAADRINASLWFKFRETMTYTDFYVFADNGPIVVNGQTIETGAFSTFAAAGARTLTAEEGTSPEPSKADLTAATRSALLPQVQEQPVAPASVENPPSQGSISGTVTPTVSPTITPTPMTTITPTVTPTITVTPTKTPTPKPTAIPTKTPTPKPTKTPTPKPTKTPTPKPTARPTAKPTTPPSPNTPIPASPIRP